MKEVTPTLLIALKVWWAWLWRAVPAALVVGFLMGVLVGIIFGILHKVMGVDFLPMAGPAGGIIGILVGMLISSWFLKRLMVKGFGKYRLAVLEKEPDRSGKRIMFTDTEGAL